jgi:hypothetical protein
MRHRFDGEMILDVSNERVTIVYKSSKYMVHAPRLKIMAIRSFETSGTTYPANQHHIPEDRKPEVGFTYFSIL